jgi:hypothetical protein
MVVMQSTRYSCRILMNLEFSRQIFEKILTYQIICKSVQWEPSCSMRVDRRTDRNDEADFRFSQFCELV